LKNYIKKTILDHDACYIDILEADVRILCTSPTNIVKSMKRKNIISSFEKDGVCLDTGPSVILLSEEKIKEGCFVNLIEFPVLQMLYKQGFVFSDKQKPIIIASSYLQICPQVEYIDMGINGITNIEKIIQNGLSKTEATDILEMKLGFGEGKFNSFLDIVDVLFTKNKTYTKVKNGVEIKRISANKYKIKYKEQTCIVDLNTAHNTEISNPYDIKKQKINMNDYFSIINTGDGNGWNKKSPAMSSIVNFNSEIYLIDTPPDIHSILTSLSIDINRVVGIFQTHVHDDHYAGILDFCKTNKKIKYISTELVRANICKKISTLFGDEYFSNSFEVVDLQLDVWNNINGLEVKPFLSAHPVDTTCMSFRAKNKKTQEYKIYTHLADISSFAFLDSMLKNKNISNDFVEKMQANYMLPATLKKIDVGGGLIHGLIEDFKNDTSDIIRYSHLDEEQGKNIKSTVDIGHVDTLIKENINYCDIAYTSTIKSIFDFCSDEQIASILSTKKTFKPLEVIREKYNSKSILMIVSGVCLLENIDITKKMYASSGLLIGRYEHNKQYQNIKYVADSFVDVVIIPMDIFEKRYISVCDDFYENEFFLYEYSPFKKYINTKSSFEIANNMKKINIKKGSKLQHDFFKDRVYLLESGHISIEVFGFTIDNLSKGSFVSHSYDSHCIEQYFDIVVNTDVVLYCIPLNIMREFPFYVFAKFIKYEKYYEKTMNIVFEKELLIDNVTFVTKCQNVSMSANIANILFYIINYYDSDKDMIDFYINRLSDNCINLQVKKKILNVKNNNDILELLNELKSIYMG